MRNEGHLVLRPVEEVCRVGRVARLQLLCFDERQERCLHGSCDCFRQGAERSAGQVSINHGAVHSRCTLTGSACLSVPPQSYKKSNRITVQRLSLPGSLVGGRPSGTGTPNPRVCKGSSAQTHEADSASRWLQRRSCSMCYVRSTSAGELAAQTRKLCCCPHLIRMEFLLNRHWEPISSAGTGRCVEKAAGADGHPGARAAAPAAGTG